MINQTARRLRKKKINAYFDLRKEKINAYFEEILALCVLAGTHNPRLDIVNADAYHESNLCAPCKRLMSMHPINLNSRKE